jgi:FAD/FMN-containing dehydrogenase/Fe-S oxidoreductase
MKTSQEIQRELGGQLEGDCLTGALALVNYSTAACIYKIRPLAVVLPKSAADVATTVRYASEHGIPVIPRGAATGLAGQVLGEGIVLDFTPYMNRVEEVDAASNRIRVQPGAILGEVNKRLAPLGKRIPQDPASEAMASLGGNIGNNAGGLRAFKIGATKHHVRGLEVVLADGTITWLRPVRPDSPEWATMQSDTGTAGRIVRETTKLLADNAALIAERRPRMEKNTAGFDLFSVHHDGLVDLTRLVVGSEGALAVVTDCEFALTDVPGSAATAVVYFRTLEKAGDAVQEILRFDPMAVEFMEKNFLDVIRSSGEIGKDFLPDAAQAVLLVEFVLGSDEANRAAVAKMVARVVDELGLAFTHREAYEPDEQARLWQLRKAALPILHRLPPPAQITAFIEDSVVPPARLAEYITRLWAILERHGVEAAMYGHAGDANLHVRPLLNLRTQKDIDTMRRIAGEAADLVLDLGGTLSGEHGDGRVRSPYLRRQFGPLYDVMRALKRIWDPAGILAPENVITDATEMHTDHLKYGADYALAETGSEYDRPEWRTEIERCHGCGTCLAHCPSYLADPAMWSSPRAKANVLKAIITGEIDLATAEAGPEMKALADLCTNCKTCRVECPSGVDIPALTLVGKARRVEREGSSVLDRMFSRPRLMGRMGSLLAPVANAMMRTGVIRKLGTRLVGLANRGMPAFRWRTLNSYAMPSGSPGSPFDRTQGRRRVALFAGCFNIFNDPDAGRAVVDVLGALGCEVILPEQACCGLPAWTAGDRKTALKDMRFNVAVLAPLVEAGYDIVSGCPSCVLSLREDTPAALTEGGDAALAKTVSGATFDVHDYLARLLEDRGKAEGMAAIDDRRVAYHSPCHLRALGHGDVPKSLLEAAGVEFALVNRTCCGMGGTFGLKDASHRLSLKIGEEFFGRLRDAKIDMVVTPCGMCKTQIEDATGIEVMHPMQLLAKALKGEAVRV